MKIKIYKKFELAKLYFPEQSKHVALNHLMRMVNHCPPLLEALRREGYERLAKTFTMRQTLLIYEYLGEPYPYLTPIVQKPLLKVVSLQP